MRRSILVVSELVLALCVVQTLAAQIRTPARGTRVRLSTVDAGSKPLIGVVDSVSGGTIVLRVGPEVSTTVTMSEVSHVEVSRGRRRPAWSLTAPIWLPLAAGGLGAAVGYATESDDAFFGRGFAAAVAGTLGGALGLLVGTSLAIGVKTEVWESVPAAASTSRASVAPSLYVAPGSRGVTLGMRAAF